MPRPQLSDSAIRSAHALYIKGEPVIHLARALAVGEKTLYRRFARLRLLGKRGFQLKPGNAYTYKKGTGRHVPPSL